jgi:NADPH2:quinone reductase
MKAFRSARLGGTFALEDIAALSPEPDEVVIALHAVGVHLADAAAAAGDRLPLPPTPFTPGLEGAGTIAAIGERVKGLEKGDFVAAFVPWGGLAEQAVTKAGLAAKLPEDMGVSVGAILPVGYAGALMALREASLRAGETLLVLGAGGAAGLAAIEIGKCLGLRVIAAASGAARLRLAAAIADEATDSGETPLAEAVMKLTSGRGADVVFDPVGGEALEAALGGIANGARIVSAGFAGGRTARVNLASLFGRGAKLLTANLPLPIQEHPERAGEALREVIAWAASGKIQPRIAAKFPLAQASHALDYAKSRRGQGGVLVTMKD